MVTTTQAVGFGVLGLSAGFLIYNGGTQENNESSAGGGGSGGSSETIEISGFDTKKESNAQDARTFAGADPAIVSEALSAFSAPSESATNQAQKEAKLKNEARTKKEIAERLAEQNKELRDANRILGNEAGGRVKDGKFVKDSKKEANVIDFNKGQSTTRTVDIFEQTSANDPERFAQYSGGGVADRFARQSVTFEEAQRRANTSTKKEQLFTPVSSSRSPIEVLLGI